MIAKREFRAAARGSDIPKYEPQAVYYSDMDYIEYIVSDELSVSERIDEYLTLIWNEDKSVVIGFRLKGFRYLFRERLKPLLRLTDNDFVLLVSVVELVFTEVGDELLGEDHRADAYKIAHQMAINDNVKVYDLPDDLVAA